MSFLSGLIPIITGGLGLASSITNRPKAAKKDPTQSALEQRLLKLLDQPPAQADPQDLAFLLNRVAGIGEGATRRAEKVFTSRGLGQSGLFGEALRGIQTDLIPGLQYQSGLDALGLARGRQQQNIANVVGAMGGVPDYQQRGQSVAGAATGGIAEMLAFLLGQGLFGGQSSTGVRRIP